MKNRKLVFGLLFIIVFGIIYGIYKIIVLNSSNNDNLMTTQVIKGDIENLVTATGTINPKNSVEVGAQVSGQLEVLYVEVGDIVNKGDLLGQIDVTVFKAKVDQTKAQLKYQEAQLKEKEAQFELSNILYKRQTDLYAQDATSLEVLQNAKLNYDSALAQIEMIKAQIEQTQSSIQADEANLKYTSIYAPMSGTVVSITAKQGQTLNANQSAPIILEIADLTTMTVKAEVSEADITKLKNGMNVYFKTMGNKRQWFSTLDKVEPTPEVENNVVLYNALFDVNNSDGKLMTYMTTQVFFVLENAKDTLILPLAAINTNKKEPTVTLLLENGTQKEQVVKLGISNRVQAQILEGLNENDVIALNTAKTTSKPNDSMPRMRF
jgi:macrolide-specific efflux system membrane fusion protein